MPSSHMRKSLGTMEPPARLEGFSLTLGVAEGVGCLLIILVAVWTVHFRGGLAWRSDPAHEFNWHPLLMTVGMIFMYANSILIYRAFRNTRKRKLKLAHLILHLVAFLMIVIALIAVFDSHNLATPPIPNMYSLHSWIGLSSVIMFSCQWVSGFITFFYPGLQTPIRSAYMPVHVFFGVAGFVAAVASALIGLTEKALFSICMLKPGQERNVQPRNQGIHGNGLWCFQSCLGSRPGYYRSNAYPHHQQGVYTEYIIAGLYRNV